LSSTDALLAKGVQFRLGTGGTTPSGSMGVISDNVDRDVQKHDGVFTQGCSRLSRLKELA
jgi:hypothetical protein